MEAFYSDKSLKDYNTFGLDISAKYFYEFSSADEIRSFFKQSGFNNIPKLILGGGSNILFTKDFKGIVFHPLIYGIEKIREDEDFVFIKAGAGENWDNFVNYCVAGNLGGLENLSFIPGTVGAAPVQNIGAYGVEAGNLIFEVETLNLENLEIEYFDNKSCKFEYRSSIFKNSLKKNHIILEVVFRLQKKHHPVTSYGNIEAELKKLKSREIADLRNLIINIRKSKLPDPAIIGNAGSFFKNPVIDNSIAADLKLKFPKMPSFTEKKGKTKISAGWLVEQCGWKGKKINDVGVYDNQALVIINFGNASGMDILNFSHEIQKSVLKEFGIDLTPEVNII
jgi:UDP-N-acetylmuramate dehydrogenase